MILEFCVNLAFTVLSENLALKKKSNKCKHLTSSNALHYNREFSLNSSPLYGLNIVSEYIKKHTRKNVLLKSSDKSNIQRQKKNYLTLYTAINFMFLLYMRHQLSENSVKIDIMLTSTVAQYRPHVFISVYYTSYM